MCRRAAGEGDGSATIRRLLPNCTSTLLQIARWRHDAFLAPDYTLEDSIRQLVSVASDPEEIALFAELDGRPAGICMMVRDELEPRHALSPWLASLFVAPPHRRQGIGRALVGTVEDHARALGKPRLYLYTGSADRFYESCGWSVLERFDWDGTPFKLMERGL